jgi:hypothetical protein
MERQLRKNKFNMTWRYTPVIPALRRLRQEHSGSKPARESSSQDRTSQKRAGGVAQGVGPGTRPGLYRGTLAPSLPPPPALSFVPEFWTPEPGLPVPLMVLELPCSHWSLTFLNPQAPSYLRAFAQASPYLALLLTNSCLSFRPQFIIIFGGTGVWVY